MMSEQEFDLKLKHIEEQSAALRERAAAFRDQEMARLFYECGWTQERIAERMGKRQQWVSYRLIFGRFLTFTTTCCKDASWLHDLTEGRFRQHWHRTKGTKGEKERFALVVHALEHGIPHGYGAIIDKPQISRAVANCLADGKWYTIEQITATAEEELVGLTAAQVSDGLRNLRYHPPAGKRLESKKIGKKSQYRLAKAPAPAAAAPLAVEGLYERAAPLLDELDELGRMHVARLSPGMVRQVAFKLRKLFDSVLAEATP